ncbi:MAG: sulfatase, partial [Verrucomicrobiota bacterium]|nr:sulfatase [Verrucomicrobiota bacterium]
MNKPSHPITENQLMVNRRQFFGRSAMCIGTAALASLLTRDGLGAPQPGGAFGGLGTLPHFAPKAKRVIYLFMNGAPTHT